MSKIIKTLKNNWKKSIFFSGCGLYGIYYLEGIYRDSLARTAYCLEAQKYGEVTVKPLDQPKRVTVFLNPAANKGKAKKLFDKNAAPLLYLAGYEVRVVKTEYEGQVKQYMNVLEDTDVVLAAGGDGTLLEVVTGLLRNEEQRRNVSIPIGVIPLGKTNRFAHKLFAKEKSDARWLLDAAMAVIREQTKTVDVLQLQSSEDRSAFIVSGLEWGAFRDAKDKIKKYWYLGGLKNRFSYIRHVIGDWPRPVTADITYTNVCEGCSKCVPPRTPPAWKWWHFMLPPRREVPTIDYSQIENEDCGKEYQRTVTSLDLSLAINDTEDQQKGMQLNIGPADMPRTDFIKEGWKRIKDGALKCDEVETIYAGQMGFIPQTDEMSEKEGWYTIDNEAFEPKALTVKYLKDKIRVFYGNSDIIT